MDALTLQWWIGGQGTGEEPPVEQYWAHEHVLRIASDEPLSLQYPEDELLELLLML